jgi:hypothetical protein
MKAFPENKALRRVIKIKSSDRAIADAQFILEIGIFGVRWHRYGSKSQRWQLSWRSILSHGLLHSCRKEVL